MILSEHELSLDKIKFITPKYLIYLYTFSGNLNLRKEIEELLMLTYKNYFEPKDLLKLIIDIYFLPIPKWLTLEK